MIEPKEITFIQNFKAFETDVLNELVDGEIGAYKDMLNAIAPLHLEVQAYERDNTPDYNLFKVLNIRHLETKVHTPFLCNLLNPHEKHGQGSLFFNAFIQLIKPNWTIDSIKYVSVKEEATFYDGRIDILIEFFVGNKKKAVVIENKIYAPDQKLQLDRYHSYLTSVQGLGLALSDIHIVYLSPSGIKPGPYSITTKNLETLIVGEAISSFSYRKDIFNWLEKAKCQIKSLPLLTIIQQYQNIIKEL